VTRADAEKLFSYGHLPPHIQAVSAPFYGLAASLFDTIPDTMGAYRTKALNELWAAKNWAVAGVAQQP
jgi:hypothetical protein